MTAEAPRRLLLKAMSVGAISSTGLIALSSPSAFAAEGAIASPVEASLRAPSGAARVPAEHSANGWEIAPVADDGGMICTRPVPGTGLEIALHLGDPENILVHVIRRFHYEIKTLRAGDVIGHLPLSVSTSDIRSNHASGTAVKVLPEHYPRGVRGGFFPHQVEIIRSILTDCDGVIEWGGDLPKPDEGAFYISGPPGDSRVTQVAQKIGMSLHSPGQGAGSALKPGGGTFG